MVAESMYGNRLNPERLTMITTPGLVSHPLTDITRPDAGHILISEWMTDSPEQQRAAMDATLDAWEQHPLPMEFLSRLCFAGTDGHTILNYAQWTRPEAHLAFAQDPRNQATLAQRITAAVGEVGKPSSYRLYRSMLPAGRSGQVPGCIVGVSFDTDGEDTARRFIDTLVDHFSGIQPTVPGGGIASHFHIRSDGRRVFNFSEWTTAEAHQRTVETQLQAGGEVANLIASIPGLRPLGFKRYLPYRGLVRPLP
ncbi:hypothetical protein JQX13_26210 [Archangium violaceum]|uniref:hypothetical protein n=1 Tax=Archangium violaceum TaxID=83451 RepID=UPI00193B5C61|nr:hypothetical protein [Archangium violaceum]QRK13217.1 hypothetical protein JQX13_26210 [Archangium violaceum]